MAAPKITNGRINGPYWIDNGGFNKDAKDGAYSLCNFVAWIDKEDTFHDGPRTATVLTIHGYFLNEKDEEVPLRPIQVDATELKTMTWVSKLWGMDRIIYPQPGAERDIATAMQIISNSDKRDIYTHIGWATIDGRTAYLHSHGAIGKVPRDKNITVQLPHELQRYALPTPTHDGAKDAVTASLDLVNLGPQNVTFPLLLATYRAAVGPADFAVHLAGRTGTFKSEVASLTQSHYGSTMDARHMPASWNSTANALEALAYKAKDAIIVLDDFVPTGTSWQVRSLQSKADQIIRAQGNQSGRTRLTDTSSVQGTMYPRGIILSTGEDVPEGHSVRARMMILELSPGDIKPAALSHAQARRDQYPAALADWISWLAHNPATQAALKEEVLALRDTYLEVGHSRTPPIIGELIGTAIIMSRWLKERGYYTDSSVDKFVAKAALAVEDAGNRQSQYLTSADPVEAFCEIIRNMLAIQQAHLKTKNGGIPADAVRYGWTKQEQAGEVTSYKHNGPCLGWLDLEKREFLFDPNALPLVKRMSQGQLAVTDQTFLKRLKDANMLTRVDSARNRNTVRAVLDGNTRNVVAISFERVFEADDINQALDEEDEGEE